MTQRVNIILAPGDVDWICGRFARELAERLPAYGIEARINAPAEWPHELTYVLPVYGPPIRRPAVGLFTHGETRPRTLGPLYDGHLTFSSTLRDWLLDGGAPALPMVLGYPVDAIYQRKDVSFGVAGRVYGDGRKGEHLVKALYGAGLDICAWGSGWPCPTVGADLRDLPVFYRSIDYYIDTSSDEGGCVPAAEAMAMGVPVISHTVGVARPVIPYERGNVESLLAVCRALTTPYTYDNFARDHAACFLATMDRVLAGALA